MEKLEGNYQDKIEQTEAINTNSEYFSNSENTNKNYQQEKNQNDLNAENIMLQSIGMKEYFDKKEYLVKKGDGFLKIIQGLLGKSITKNINGELLVYLSQTLDIAYKNTGNTLLEGDNIKLENGNLLIKDKNNKTKFSVKLPFTDIKYENINTYQGGKYLKNNIASSDNTSVNINKKYIKGVKNINNIKDDYEQGSEFADKLLIVAGVGVGAGIVILGSGAIAFAGISYGVISTTLMCVSLAKSLLDANHSYQKNGEISKKDITKIGVNIGASVLDRFTMNNGKSTIRLAGSIIDEFSDQIGIYAGNQID